MWFTKLIPLIFLVIRTGSTAATLNTALPLRILTALDSSIDSLQAPQRDLIEDSLLPAVLKWVGDNIHVDPQPSGKLLIDRTCIGDRSMDMMGVRKCIAGCESNQQCGTHIIPPGHLGACTKYIGGISTPAGEGVKEDFILYISAGECDDSDPGVDSDPGNDAVQGKYCKSSQADKGRPTHGYMKFCTQELNSHVSKYEELVHKTLQKMLHILAFDKSLLPRFTDQDGNKHRNSITEINRNFEVAGEDGDAVISRSLNYILLPTVVEELKSHFDCDKIPGAQLESEEAVSTGQFIYFEKLFFGNELMTAGLQGRGVISRMTWAFLKDSGWYYLPHDFSEPLVWGKDAKCPFANKFCYEQLSASQYSPEDVAPFCVEPGKSKCASDHRGYGVCNIDHVAGPVPEEYRNFDKDHPHSVEGMTTVGTDVYADRCPYHEHSVMCTDVTQQPQLDSFGEAYTGFSRCFDYVGNWTSHVQNAHQQSSGCYPIECGTDSYTVRVSKNTYTCTTNATIQVQNILMNIPFDGTLRCPDYNIVCAGQVGCTKNCNGNGKCISGVEGEEDQCLCYPGYHGDNCNLSFGVDYCSVVPCQSGSDCVNDEAGTFSCNCTDDKTGVLCHLSSSSCTPTYCENKGRCEDREGTLFCTCPAGFTGDRCEESLAPCPEDNNPCTNEAECFLDPEAPPEADGVLCACPFSYEGTFCDKVKECDIFGPLACKNGGQCVKVKDTDDDIMECSCPENFFGDFCEIEICLENTCNGNGECLPELLTQTITCTCNEGFSGDRCEIGGEDEEEGEEDAPSQLDQCVVLRRCTIVDGRRECEAGWTGKDCMSVDHCENDPCEIHHTARCISLEDRFECECYPGYEGELCKDKVDGFNTEPTTSSTSPPLLDHCEPDPCFNGATCISNGQTYMCNCSEGFTGINCENEREVDHCEPDPCFNGATCISNGQTYFCNCSEEFTGTNCETERGVCYKKPCKNGGSCAQGKEPADFSCSCPVEWTGPTCEEAVDPCEVLNCINGGTCQKIGNSATCDCPMGYGGDRCENKESHCYREPCDPLHGECEYHAEHHNYTCHCNLGWIGPTCSEEMENSCTLVSECQYNTACVGSHDDYTCECPDGLEGDRCEINPNDCDGNPCQGILFSQCVDLIGDYDCACMQGFEKKSDQCGDVNECVKDNPCINGICINLPGKYKCFCRAGWAGNNCDVDIDECIGHKCQNGAQCVDLIADYRCECVNKYKGQYCETAPLPCELEPCENGATCTDVDETNFRCTCPAGFEGERCETNIDDCASDPCGEHGTCVDGVAEYTCECDVGYSGRVCAVYVGQCFAANAMNPCANDAQCVDLPDRKFECICPDFYEGELCDENIDDCASEPCANGGSCKDGLGTFTCYCTAQWTGTTCEEDVNECEDTDICQNGGTCLNEQGGFSCNCSAGYSGDLCETNIDDCVDHQCVNDGVCVDGIAGYDCQCSDKFSGTRCEIEVQFCQPDSCLNNGTCSVVDNVIQCDCSDTGFEGAQCETEIDECVSQNITCLHEGTCVDEVLGYHCDCPCAFTGPLCEEEKDFCADQQCVQENTFMCVSLVNSCDFKCQCEEGWEGDLCETDIDECADNPCVHGNCTDGLASYTCSCDEGYRGENCDDPLDKCAAQPCKNGASCETIVEGEERYFECTCTVHYHGDTCEEKHAPCYISPCGDHGLCQVDGDRERCTCDDGFTGTFCEINIDDCERDPCKNGATCHDKIMDFQCDCLPGYGGRTCEALRDPCIDSDLCQNGAKCSECTGKECENRYTCTCAPGFVGTNCETDVDDCEGSPCVRGECFDLVNDYECECPVGYTDKNCETEIDECASRPCLHHQECIDEIANYTCNCVGFTGRNCETDIDECETGQVTCLNGGTCQNTPGSYFCDCPDGFGGDQCEREVLPCDLHAHRCLNLATCENLGVSDYQCGCTGGYTGDHCEIPNEVCNEENNPCIHGTCVDEDGDAVCRCDPKFSFGEFCEKKICQADICQNNGGCEDTAEGYECRCVLPWVGRHCEKKANILQFKPKSKASIPLGKITEKEVRVKMGLKIKDMTTKQQVFEQATSLGQLSLKLVDSKIQLTLEETRLELPIMDKFATVSVILVDDYLELVVGNQTEVSVFSEAKKVVPSGGMQFGAVPSTKREAVSSYTGCLVDIGNIDIINMAEGEGFDECSDEETSEDVENIEVKPTCENGGIRVGPYCQCPEGYRGDLCEIEIGENCKSINCPGDCRETSQGPQCVCSWPKEGDSCTDLTIIPSFRADSSLVFKKNHYKKFNRDNPVYELSIEINPEYPRGFIVMFEGRNGFCSMYLDGNIFFDCMVSGEYTSREHSLSIQLDHWSLIRVYINYFSMSISVDNSVEVFDCSDIQDLNLDGSITFGSIPEGVNISGTNLEASSIPGFFGEIHPITLNDRKAKLKESQGVNVVSAKSRDLTEDYTSPCKKSPCGDDNTCYERASGHGCLCELNPSGSDCSGTPELLSFLGSDSYAMFNTRYEDSNEFKIRFKSEAEEGILLYGASKYKEKSVPQSQFYLALKDGAVHFGLYEKPDVFKSLSLELSTESWNTVTLTLHAQKASLSVSGKHLDNTVRTKFQAVELFRKNQIYVGGAKDLFGINHLNKKFEAEIPLSPFVGQVSEFTLNNDSLMGSLNRVNKVSADGTPPACGISPCGSGSCYGDGMCQCDNDLRYGDLCEEPLSFVPMRITEGYVAYHKHFDIGNSLMIKFYSPLINTEDDAVILRINTMFIEDRVGSLEFKLSDFTFDAGSIIRTLTFERKMNHIRVVNGNEQFEKEFSSDTKLEKEFFIGLGDNGFTGKIFSVQVDGEELTPAHGKNLSQTLYPPCYYDPCLNGAECIETTATEYTCNCTAGHTGAVCGELIDMCEPNPCNDTSRCFSVEGTSYLCKPCPRGYHGFDCQDKAFCELLTPCTHGDLVGNCTETEDSYSCDCGDGKDRRDCDLSDTCDQVECLNNATCVETNDEFECQCDEAFEGRYCEIPVDNCAEDTCQNGGTCISLFDERKYFCLCALGYSGDNCEIVQDMCEDDPCLNAGTCSTVDGMFACDCPEPYFGHDCSGSPCDALTCNEGQCEIQESVPVCSCNAGYTGEHCDQDVNECLEPTACSNFQGKCSNTIGNYSCECYSGFEGRDCEINIDDCSEDSCNGNGFCMDGYNSFTCLCDALYTGEFCEEKSDMCSPDPCQNGAKCYNYGIDHFCICPQGYEGVNCSVNSDDCQFNRCENGRCVDELNGYSCDCEGRYTGDYCSKDVDECFNNPCLNDAQCTNTFGGYECKCPEFFSGQNCEVSLGECHGNPCLNGGECYELGVVGEGRVCRCLEGWTGEDCEIRVTECDINPCQNGGACLVSDRGFLCECKYPHSGPHCNTRIIVPYLSSVRSFVSFETSIVDIAAGFEFRFRPEKSGIVFHLVYDNFFLNAMYNEANELIFTANLDGRVTMKTSSASISDGDWNKVHIKASGKAITLTVNSDSDVMNLKTSQLKSILRKRHEFYIGDNAKKNSFVGCFYDMGQDLGYNGVEFDGIEHCSEGNTCRAGHLGPCGDGGQCNELGHCDCPLGRDGQYCEKDRASRNPSFNRDGYLLLEDNSADSYVLSLAAQGTGAVFVGYDKKGREIVSLVIESTNIKLTGSSQETIYIKGYDGAWMDLILTFDTSDDAVFVELGTGEEMMTLFKGSKKLSKLYLGGSPTFSNNFRGCFTEVKTNGREAAYDELVNVVECAMEGCYENACQNTVNDYNDCVSNGPRYFSCKCGHNYVGSKCDVQWKRETPRFNGNSFLTFLNPDNTTNEDLIMSIVFKVTGKSGILFSTEPSDLHADYVNIGISRGRLYLSYDLGAGSAFLKCPRRVDDGKWHFLHMTLRGRHAVLMVDRWTSEVMSPGQRNVLNVGPYLYLGGTPTEPGITGCVESLSVRDEPMTMSDTVASSNIDYCEDNVPESSIYKLKYRLK